MGNSEDSGALRMKKSDVGFGLLIELNGILNSDTSKDVRPELLKDSSGSNTILDLSNVQLITSSGVGVLFELTDNSTANNKKVILLNPSERVQKVINLTGFNDLFITCSSIDEVKKLLQ